MTILAAALFSAVAPPSNAGAQGQLEAAMHDMHRAMEVPASGDFDVDFARMMIAHHQGAIDMAKLQLLHGKDPRLQRLAQKIIIEQNQEIRTMLDVLASQSGSNDSAPAPAVGAER